MKSTLKYFLKNRLVILGIIDIAIIFWIGWFEGRIQYEPLLDDATLEERKLPLEERVYDIMILGIIVNTIILLSESRHIRKRVFVKYDLPIAFAYFGLITFCLLLGYLHIMEKSHCLVIREENTMFLIPIRIVGEERFTSVITVKNLYLSLCVIHICTCLLYMYLCLCKWKKRIMY